MRYVFDLVVIDDLFSPQNMTSGVSVIRVRATDEDENDQVEYTIQSGERRGRGIQSGERRGWGIQSGEGKGVGHPVR